MLKESLKWMLLSLLIAGLVFCLVYWGIRAVSKTFAPPAPTPTLAPPPTETPAPTHTPAPSQTPSPTPLTKTQEERLLSYVAAMPINEKLGQLALFLSLIHI